MAYSWFRVDSSVVDHPKVLLLSARLGDPNALAYMVRLWSWVQRYATTGFIDTEIVDQVERAMGWKGADGALVSALTEVGLLDAENGGVSVHDWDEMQGGLVEKSKKDAEKKRRRRRDGGAISARAAHVPGARAARLRTDETDGRTDVRTKRVAGSPPPPVQNEVFELKKPPPGPPDAVWQVTITRLVEVYAQSRGGAKYAFSGRDARALKTLLATLTADDVVLRWRRALGHSGFPAVASLHELAANANHFAGAGPVKDLTSGVAPPSTGHVVGLIDTSRKAAQ